MKNPFLAILLLFSIYSYGQEEAPVYNFAVVENKPIYPGCEDIESEEERFACMNKGIMTHLAENFHFPEKAVKKGIQGTVYVSFIIEKNGEVSHVKVVRGVHRLLNKEAVKAVESLPTFTPARQKGKNVRMQYTIPISAKLN